MNVSNSLFPSSKNNLITNSNKNSQSINKPLFSDNNSNLSKPLFGNGNHSNNLFANNNSTSLFSNTNGDNSNPNPFKAFNSGSANPFAASNPFLGSNQSKNANNLKRDNTSQDNKSFGDFFKQANNTKNEDDDDDEGDDNPEQENEWTRNMNPDLKYTAKSSIKSTKDQLDYKNEYVCVTKC